MADLQVGVEDKIFQRLIEESAIQQVTIQEAVQTAIREWCENRAYMRSGREEKRRRSWMLDRDVIPPPVVKTATASGDK